MSLAKPKGVRFSEDELVRLQHAAEAQGISVNDLIRKLVDKGLTVLENENFALNLQKIEFMVKKPDSRYSGERSVSAARLNDPSSTVRPKR